MALISELTSARHKLGLRLRSMVRRDNRRECLVDRWGDSRSLRHVDGVLRGLCASGRALDIGRIWKRYDREGWRNLADGSAIDRW